MHRGDAEKNKKKAKHSCFAFFVSWPAFVVF